MIRRGRARWQVKNGKAVPLLLEEDVVTQIMEGLCLAGIKVSRVRERIPGSCSPRNLSTPGIPDLVGWIPRNTPRISVWKSMGTITHHGYPAAPLFIEVKRPGGARRPAQEQWIAGAQADGCVAFFAESYDDCVRELGNHGIKLPH